MFEAVNQILQDIIQIDEPFRKKTFIFEGDFCQILLVISYASYADIVSTSLYRSSV